jgi:predicted HD phosphohydrolase
MKSMTGKNTKLRRADFTTLQTATPEDLTIVRKAEAALFDELPGRIIEHLQLLEFVPNGHPITQLEHSLQAATRAHQDGRDEEYVVCALLHDVGDILCPHSHADFAAMLLKPFVSESLCWMIEKHTIFQKKYYFDTLGRDPNEREKYRDSPYFDMTVEFCERYDQCSFDPDFRSLPLESFYPMVERIFQNKYQDQSLI